MRYAAIAVTVATLLGATPASADKLEWRDEWPTFRTSEWVVSIAAGTTVGVMYIIPRVTPTWGHPILFDASVRDALRADPGSTRNAWETWGTVGYIGLGFYPIVVDSLIVPLSRDSSKVAAQTTLINLQSFAITGLVFRITESTVRRARPHVWECKEQKGNYDDCTESGIANTNSFIAGHVAIAATGAALMCTHHAHLRLYGGAWDAIACGVGIAVAGGVGVSRIVADKHYMTDTIAGITVGTLSGWLLPTLLHYGFDGRGRGTSASLKYIPLPTASATSVGLSWSAVL